MLLQEEQRRLVLSVALEARLSRFLKGCAHDWATGTHAGAGCTLPFLVPTLTSFFFIISLLMSPLLGHKPYGSPTRRTGHNQPRGPSGLVVSFHFDTKYITFLGYLSTDAERGCEAKKQKY
jgi:hypothetical protein